MKFKWNFSIKNENCRNLLLKIGILTDTQPHEYSQY